VLACRNRGGGLVAAPGSTQFPSAVRTVFSWSYRHLDPAAARMFRLLSLHPGPDLDRHAHRRDRPEAEQILSALTRAHLTQLTGPGRYSMHDLLRAYARDLAADNDTSNEQQTALTRLFDHYLHTAATAMDTLFPASGTGGPASPHQPPQRRP
jgi:hypothetical protein